MREHVSTELSKRRKYPRDSDGRLFNTLVAKSLIIFLLFSLFLFSWRVFTVFMMVLFLPFPHFHQYNPSSFFSSYPIAPSALKVPTCASNLFGEASAPCCLWRCPGCQPRCRYPRTTPLANFNSRERLFHLAGCRIFSNNPEKERCDVSKQNICKDSKWCYSHAVTAVPEFQLHGWIPVPFSHSYIFYAIFDYSLRMQIIRNNK